MNYLAITAFLALGGTALGDYPTIKDLREALGTPDPFWLEYRSYKPSGPEHSCVSSRKAVLTDYEYAFTQSYKVGADWHHDPLFARLLPGDGSDFEPILDVSKTQGKPGIQFTLR
uniref:Secreted protein n=1 Tax=Amblyomma americanum TaxID=6943 RepID=A0A0C9R4E5_AMBAM